MAQYRNINVRSPFYVQLGTAEDSVSLELRLWTGDVVSAKPTDATYTLVKEASAGSSTFEIADLVRDFCSQSESFQSGTCWVETILDDGVATPTTVIYLASEGYSLYKEGVQHNGNSWQTDFVALPESIFTSNYHVLTSKGRYTYFQVYTQPQSADWKYNIIDQNGVEGADVIMTPSTTSSGQFVTFPIGQNISGYKFDFDGEEHRVTSDEAECNKYNSGALSLISGYSNVKDDQPVMLHYVNKLGAKNGFPFTMKFMEKISSKSDTFNRSVMNYTGLTHQNGKHSTKKRLTGSIQKFTVNTDWIDQYYIEQLEELLLSEYVWATIPKIGDSAFPVNITTKQLDKKTHLNDKMIQFTFEFEGAAEYVNTMR
jgi:hypothetical protein